MAEQNLGKKPNQKRHQRQKPFVPQLTDEQKAVIKANAEKAAAEAAAEVARIQNWEKRVEKMSDRQVHAEVKRIIRGERTKVGKDLYEPVPSLTNLYATVFDNILTNTKTKENPFGKLSCYVR